MKQFNELKIGDKIGLISTKYTHDITNIEKIDDTNCIKITTTITSYVVEETATFSKQTNAGGIIITPEENLETLHQIYCEGIINGKVNLANSIKNLLLIY